MRGSRARPSDPNAPFYVMIRDAERKILREAYEYHNSNIAAASGSLGITPTLFHKRTELLGGVLPNQPRREPFEYMKVKQEIEDAKRRRARARAKRKLDRASKSSDETNGAADHPDRIETGDGDSTASE